MKWGVALTLVLGVVPVLAQGVSGASEPAPAAARGASQGECVQSWVPVSPTLATGELTDAIHAPGIGYVVVGRGGAVVSSPDGVTWTPRWTGFPGDFFAVTWGNGLFVAVGSVISAEEPTSSPLIATSEDGIIWTRRDRPEHRQSFGWMAGVAWTGLAFVAVSTDKKAWVSVDGLNWPADGTIMEGAARFIPADLAWDGMRLITVGEGSIPRVGLVVGIALASPDGVHWQFDSSFSSGGRHVRRLAAHDGVTVVIADDRLLILTAPGRWHQAVADADSRFLDVVWTGSSFLVTRYFSGYVTGDRVLTSPDGLIWTSLGAGLTLPNAISGLAAGPGLLLGFGTAALFSSPDGRVWVEHTTTPLPRFVSDMTWTGRDFVAVTGDAILTSADGVAWQTRQVAAGSGLGSVVSGDGTVLVVGANGKILRRTAGDDWEERTLAASLEFAEVVWAGTRFLAIDRPTPSVPAALFVSLDGIEWERLPGVLPAGLHSLIWSGRQLIGWTDSGWVVSPNGEVWEQAGSGAEAADAAGSESSARGAKLQTAGMGVAASGATGGKPFAANASTFVHVGMASITDDVICCGCNFGLAAVSRDFVNWHYVHFPAVLESVIWDGKRFLAAGQCGYVASSPDGEHWSVEISMSGSDDLETIASSGRAAVVAGGFSMVAQPDCTPAGTIRRHLGSDTSRPLPAWQFPATTHRSGTQ